MEAISHAGACHGIITSEGIILAAERKVTSKLLDQQYAASFASSVGFKLSQEKLFQISNDIWCAVAGLTSDANLLIDWARQRAAQWLMTYGEPIPIEQLVEAICDLKQGYTQKGGTIIAFIIRYASIWCIFPVCRMGFAFRLSAVSNGPIGKL